MKCSDAIFTKSGKHDKIWRSLLYEKPVKISGYIIVQHSTTPKWIEYFQQNGINGTISPPDSRAGRVSIVGKNLYQSRINNPGLYIQRVNPHTSGILIAIKQNEIKLSTEAKQFGKNPLAGLYLNEDAIILGRIPPQRVLGATNYEYGYYGEKPGWSFIPNPACIGSKFRRLAECIHYNNSDITYGRSTTHH